MYERAGGEAFGVSSTQSGKPKGVAAALAANAIEIQQQIKIIDVEKYRTRVSFIQEDLRRSTGVLSNHRDKGAQREENHFRRLPYAVLRGSREQHCVHWLIT